MSLVEWLHGKDEKKEGSGGFKHGNGRNKEVQGRASSHILNWVYEYALELPLYPTLLNQSVNESFL